MVVAAVGSPGQISLSSILRVHHISAHPLFTFKLEFPLLILLHLLMLVQLVGPAGTFLEPATWPSRNALRCNWRAGQCSRSSR